MNNRPDNNSWSVKLNSTGISNSLDSMYSNGMLYAILNQKGRKTVININTNIIHLWFACPFVCSTDFLLFRILITEVQIVGHSKKKVKK